MKKLEQEKQVLAKKNVLSQLKTKFRRENLFHYIKMKHGQLIGLISHLQVKRKINMNMFK